MNVIGKKQSISNFINEKITGGKIKGFKIEPQICFLFVCFVLLHLTYVQAVIPPQVGWWNYFAWRINKGEILYKDIFCYLPPYYVYLVSFLYKLFGNFIMGYQILGLFLRWSEVYVVYSVTSSLASKNVSFLCTFVGLVLQISYLMDIPFDYNQMIRFYVIMSSFFCVKALLHEKEKLANIYLGISGIWLGIGLFSKQTCAVIIFFVVLGIMIFYLQRQTLTYVIRKIALFVSGVIIASLPGIIGLLVQGSFDDFIYCITSSMTVKGDFGGFGGRVMEYQFHFLEVMIAVLLFLLLLFQDKYEKGYCPKLFRPSTRIIAKEIYWFLAFVLTIYRSCQIIHTQTGIITSYIPILNSVLIYIGIRISLVCLRYAVCKVGQENILGYCKKLTPIVIAAVLVCSIIITYCVRYQWKYGLYNQLSLFNLKRALINVIFWVMLMVLIYQIIQFIIKQEIYGGMKAFVLNAFTMCLTCLCMISSVVEELFMLPTAALFFAMVINAVFTCSERDNRPQIRNLLYRAVVATPVIGLMVICIFITVVEKQVVAYTWHRWDSIGLGIDNVNYVYSTVDGLEGYKLDLETEIAYETIVNLINEYTDEEDIVYQFPNVPLFNVLTERKIGTYDPIHYFDVCPDEIAIADAGYLVSNPPKMVIWCEFGEGLWDFHEAYFRDGNPSGQRAIRDFYINDVQQTYQKLYEYKSLSLWLREE